MGWARSHGLGSDQLMLQRDQVAAACSPDLSYQCLIYGIKSDKNVFAFVH